MAVGRGAGCRLGAHCVARPRAIVDHDLHTELLGKRGGDDAGKKVRGATGTRGSNIAHRPIRKIGRRRSTGQDGVQYQDSNDSQIPHSRISSFRAQPVIPDTLPALRPTPD
jgi:hypothetical protein